MMSDKSAQHILANSAIVMKSQHSKGKYAPLPVLNRSGATTEAIKSYILQHGLGPGDPLPTEAELCSELGVSRSSVREALRKLEALSIVAVRQGRGTFVGDMSLMPMVETLILSTSISGGSSTASLANVVALRKYLDIGMAHDVVSACEGKKHKDLHAVIDIMVEKAQRHERFLEEDSLFHTGILEIIHNEVATQLVSALWLAHMVVVPILEEDRDDLLLTALAHRSILESAEAGDIDGYREAISAHYRPLEMMLRRHDEEEKEKGK